LIERVRAFVEEKRGLEYRDEKGCLYPLDKNENLLIPRELVREILWRAAEKADPRRYPECEEGELREEIAKLYSVEEGSVVITNGGDEAIDLILALVGSIEKSPRIAILRPSFPMYSLRSFLRGYRVEYIGLSEQGFELDVERAVEVASRSDLVFLCSPNNPTGNLLPRDAVKAIAEASRGMVVLDKAYREFADDPQDDLVGVYENLVAIGTFSKAYGLAGLRLGYAIANPEVARALKILRLPFQVDKLSLLAGLEALRMREKLLGYVEEVKRLRKILVSRLGRLGYLEAYDTQTNFVLSKVLIDVERVLEALRARGICVKHYRGMFMEGDAYLRITVPDREALDLLVGVLESVS